MVRMTRVTVLDWPKVTRQFGGNWDLCRDQPSREVGLRRMIRGSGVIVKFP